MNQPPQPPQRGPQPVNPYPQPMPQGQVPYSAQPQGAYPMPASYPQMPPHMQQYGQPRGPSKGAGIAKIILGLGVSAVMLLALLMSGHENAGVAGVLGLMLGFGLRFLATGGANLVGKKIPFLPSLAVPVLFAVIGGAAGPAMSGAYWRATEASTFERCAASTNRYDWWDYFGTIPDQFQRTEAKALQMKADLQWEIEQKNYVQVRIMLGRIKTEFNNDPAFDIVVAAAAEGMGKAYDEALAKLNQPGKATEEAEFKVDEDLRKAFSVILKDLSTAESPDVYVAFSNASDLTAPEGHEVGIAYWRSEPSVKAAFGSGEPKIIDPGEAFSAKYDAARRNTFMAAGDSAFAPVFGATLLTLKPLGDKQERKGHLVLEVSSKIVRTDGYFNRTETGPDNVAKSKGLLFGIEVEWTFSVFDRAGKQLYTSATKSSPASNISLLKTANEPEWGVYSILMDSAYYNYSRQIIGQFGLEPPPEKRAFGYRAAGG